MAVLAGIPTAGAQPIDIPETWGGDLLSRPRLTGDWGGVRDAMGKKGLVLDVDILLTPQGVVSGGRNKAGEFWGNTEYTLNFDTDKAGLWPGGFLKVVGNSGFGDNILKDSGLLGAANTAAFGPTLGENTSTLSHATFMQFLHPKFGLAVGKFFTLDAPGEFTGNYRTQFQNVGLVVPLAAAFVPISAYGAGVIALPCDNLMLMALTLDPHGKPTEDDLGDIFENGVTEVATAALKVKPFGLIGHQTLGFVWSTADRISLIQDPANVARQLLLSRFPRLGNLGPVLTRLLERRFPGLIGTPVQPLNTENDTWSVFYKGEQYLWQPEGHADRGLGVFYSFGASDGDANPVRFSYTLGLSGRGITPGRPGDSFGVGWSAIDLTDNFLPFLRDRLNLGLGREDAVEAYYNFRVTPWLEVTADLQVINPGLQKTIGSGGTLDEVDTTVVAGGRIYIRL